MRLKSIVGLQLLATMTGLIKEVINRSSGQPKGEDHRWGELRENIFWKKNKTCSNQWCLSAWKNILDFLFSWYKTDHILHHYQSSDRTWVHYSTSDVEWDHCQKERCRGWVGEILCLYPPLLVVISCCTNSPRWVSAFLLSHPPMVATSYSWQWSISDL